MGSTGLLCSCSFKNISQQLTPLSLSFTRPVETLTGRVWRQTWLSRGLPGLQAMQPTLTVLPCFQPALGEVQHGGRECGLWSQASWVQIPTLPLTGCVIRLLCFLLENRDNNLHCGDVMELQCPCQGHGTHEDASDRHKLRDILQKTGPALCRWLQGESHTEREGGPPSAPSVAAQHAGS